MKEIERIKAECDSVQLTSAEKRMYWNQIKERAAKKERKAAPKWMSYCVAAASVILVAAATVPMFNLRQGSSPVAEVETAEETRSLEQVFKEMDWLPPMGSLLWGDDVETVEYKLRGLFYEWVKQEETTTWYNVQSSLLQEDYKIRLKLDEEYGLVEIVCQYKSIPTSMIEEYVDEAEWDGFTIEELDDELKVYASEFIEESGPLVTSTIRVQEAASEGSEESYSDVTVTIKGSEAAAVICQAAAADCRKELALTGDAVLEKVKTYTEVPERFFVEDQSDNWTRLSGEQKEKLWKRIQLLLDSPKQEKIETGLSNLSKKGNQSTMGFSYGQERYFEIICMMEDDLQIRMTLYQCGLCTMELRMKNEDGTTTVASYDLLDSALNYGVYNSFVSVTGIVVEGP